MFRPRLVFSADAPTSQPARTGPAPPEQAGRFRELMLPHLDAAYNLARYLARDPVAAEDIVQDAFLRAFRSFHTFAGGNAKAWLFAIVRNGFLDWRKANPRIDLGEEFLEGAGADHNHPEAILVREGEAKALRETLANLPEPFRETLVLRELEELSYKEISQLTGAPIGTVMSRLARARAMLGALMFAGEGRGLEARP